VGRAAGWRRLALAGLGAALFAQPACVVLPVRIGPPVSGLVVDQASGRPVAGALVVVRIDGRYDDVLPDRDLIGHQETRTDANGRFRLDRLVRPGFSAWPLLKTEARIVGVMHEGYRCAAPRSVPEGASARIALVPALDALDRRESCRPVTAERGEAMAYMEQWRALFAEDGPRPPSESERQLERLLAARAALGFGENCVGPVTDLAVAPGGERAAIRSLDGDRSHVQRIELASGARSPIRSPADASPDARLAWVTPSELVLLEPDTAPQRALAPSSFAVKRVVKLWSGAAPPAAPAPGSAVRPRPLDPEHLSDESDALWQGRSFALARTLDARSGLPGDELRVVRPDGSAAALALPGETCGPSGRFGRPHYRMAADGRSGLDVRFVDGGCHAVRIDFETGAWTKLDAARSQASCHSTRRIPSAHLTVALRGYMREVASALADGGADPVAAFVLEIAPDGETFAQARDFAGGRRGVRVPRFPLATPLRRIDVSTVGLARPEPRGAGEPLAEPEPL
jgi:hypothetical protein